MVSNLSFVIVESGKTGTKVIIWKRSMSSSSRNPLARAVKDDDASDSGSDFVDEFCMIAGRHSSSLERLYAWERKLFDEVKVLIHPSSSYCMYYSYPFDLRSRVCCVSGQ